MQWLQSCLDLTWLVRMWNDLMWLMTRPLHTSLLHWRQERVHGDQMPQFIAARGHCAGEIFQSSQRLPYSTQVIRSKKSNFKDNSKLLWIEIVAVLNSLKIFVFILIWMCYSIAYCMWPSPVQVVTHKECIASVKNAYVNFLNHCYVDTEVEMKEIYSSNHIWTLFDDFMADIERVTSPEGVKSKWVLTGLERISDSRVWFRERSARQPAAGLHRQHCDGYHHHVLQLSVLRYHHHDSGTCLAHLYQLPSYWFLSTSSSSSNLQKSDW